MSRRVINYIIFLLLIPALIIVWATTFDAQNPAAVCIIVCILACIPFFTSFEKDSDADSSRQIVLVASITALCVASRIIFAAIPGFKPVTAIIVIAALYLGPQCGFMIGALTALLSNFYFGQGAWTPMQMLAWGLCGFFAGIFSNQLIKKRVFLLIFGALSGIMFSLIMDIWSVLWIDKGFNITRYFIMVASSTPAMVTYIISNVIFILIIEKPFGIIMKRIKSKYGL
ncbi:MAG: ECF transporter S component [Negativicutes bacterium]|nr:ECF transporter S component [Negativicutes bacterium]